MENTYWPFVVCVLIILIIVLWNNNRPGGCPELVKDFG